MLGLLSGLLLPQVAAHLQPWLPQMVAILLTITALRIGWGAAIGAIQDLRWGLGMVSMLQLAVPLIGLALLWLVNPHQSPAALAFVLATAAPAISGIKASGSSCTGDASCLGELELELSVETSRERQGDEGSVDDAAELTLMCCSTSLGDEGDDELAVAPSLPSCSSSLDPMAAISPMPAA